MSNTAKDYEELLTYCPNTTVDLPYVAHAFFPLVYGIPTIALTVVLVVTIIIRKALHSVFFFQFLVFGSVNCIYWLVALTFNKVFSFPVSKVY